MPSFCRHNRLIQNCPICSREQQVELRPIVTPRPESGNSPRPAGGAGRGGTGVGSARKAPASGAGRTSSGTGVRVRRLRRGAEDGYHSPLLPGLKSSADAERLAQEIAFAAFRLERLAADPPGLFAEVASGEDLEERTWLAFQIAYLGPLEEEDPFAVIEQVRTTWASGALPDLEGVRTGPRSAHEPERGAHTLDSYRAWAARAGSQAQAFSGEAAWTPERRFERLFERLALPGLHRDARYDLLVTLGRTSVYELNGAVLQFVGENKATLGAKRALGIGDTLLLERRAAALAEACGVPLEALDLALHNWESGTRLRLGLEPDAEPEPEPVEQISEALGL